jgi:RNA polymerase subunit RPABC4/transcription elongation factor Spt4
MSAISAFGLDHGWSQAIAVALIVLVAYILTMWIAAVLWTFNDIVSRTYDAGARTLSVLLVAVFNVPGLLLYLLLRPGETLAERAELRLEMDAFAREAAERPVCPGCRRPVDQTYLACPYCAQRLATPCEGCKRNLEDSWNVCPYCLHERGAAATAPRVARRGWRPAPAPAPAGMPAQPIVSARRHI